MSDERSRETHDRAAAYGGAAGCCDRWRRAGRRARRRPRPHPPAPVPFPHGVLPPGAHERGAPEHGARELGTERRGQLLRKQALARQAEELRTLRLSAKAYLVFSLLVMVGANVPAIGNLLPDLLVSAFMPIDRENLGPARILHLLCVALLFSYFVPADWKGFHSKFLQPIIKCGASDFAAG